MDEVIAEVPDYAIERTLSSGFKIAITPLPPYYADIIEDLYPLLDYPAREIKLMAGDIFREPYEPGEIAPDPLEDEEGYGLWLRWHEVDEYNEITKKKRVRAKRDLLFSLCVNILDGPVDIKDKEWLERLEAPFVEDKIQNDVVLAHAGQKRLLFLKYVVITDKEAHDLVINDAMFPEVSLEGIGHALSGFRSPLGQSILRGDFGRIG